MATRNLTLLTDLYELTMMQGYFKDKTANANVIFDAFFRRNPGSGPHIAPNTASKLSSAMTGSRMKASRLSLSR